MIIIMKNLLSIVIFCSFTAHIFSHDLEGAINSSDRSSKNIARDEYRNPYETLTFFEIKSNMKVVELSPGGGWYTEILANYLHDPGMLNSSSF